MVVRYRKCADAAAEPISTGNGSSEGPAPQVRQRRDHRLVGSMDCTRCASSGLVKGRERPQQHDCPRCNGRGIVPSTWPDQGYATGVGLTCQEVDGVEQDNRETIAYADEVSARAAATCRAALSRAAANRHPRCTVRAAPCFCSRRALKEIDERKATPSRRRASSSAGASTAAAVAAALAYQG